MPKRQNTAYAAPEQLDRLAFGAYFMGAIFPLVTLAVVVERYVLPDLGDPVYGRALIGLVISLSTLSLCSFFLLRRSARASLRRRTSPSCSSEAARTITRCCSNRRATVRPRCSRRREK